MNRFLSLLLIAGFLTIWIIGLSMMNSHEDCLFGKLDNCAGGIWAMINSHISAFQTLFGAIVISLVAFISFLLASFLSVSVSSPGLDFTPFREHALQGKSFISLRKFSRWLALREHSPSFLLARV